MSEVEPTETEKIIKAIQDIAIILTGAAEFVCEKRMIRRFSRHIEDNLEKLVKNVELLKQRFPGKFPEKLEVDSSLEKIRDVTQALKENNTNIEVRCRSGELGNTLSIRATELKTSITTIFDTLGGKISKYTITDRFAAYGERMASFLFGLLRLVSKTGRIFLALLLVVILSFVYLYLTMESENTIFKSIQKDSSYIQEQKDILAKKTQEYKEIEAKIKSFDQTEMSKEDKIMWLGLSTKENRRRELLEQIESSIQTREKIISEKIRKIEEIRKKSFFQRLLKR